MFTKMKIRRVMSLAGGAVACLITTTIVLAPPGPRSGVGAPAVTASAVDLASIPGASAGWWAQVSENLEREEYTVTSAAGEGLQAPNRAQGFRTSYRPAEVEIVPRQSESGVSASWRFSWQTARFGRPGQMQEVGPASPEADGSRVVYTRAGLVEWYDNRNDGLEQGFTVHDRPGGAGALKIEGAIGGGLRPELREDGEVDLLDANGARVLHYGKLSVWDANRREIDSRIAVAGDALAILVEDGVDTAYPITVDPLLTSPSWTGESNQAGARLGKSVATAGDVNGDGFSDVIIGAPYFDNGQTDEGRAFLYHGSAAGLSTTPAWTSESDQTNSHWGASVAAAGDVNGDGFPDVIVGAPDYDNGQTDEGRASVYLGAASGLAASPAWTAEAQQDSAVFGTSVATGGDVNGDGYADVIVGAWLYNNGQPDEGRAFVYHGSGAGVAASPAWTTESNQALAHLGGSVGTAGDVNGDGFADVIVGAHLYDNAQTNEGRAFVYHGSASGLTASPLWTAESDQASAVFGISVGTAGDVNGDGFADVIVGASLFDNGEANEGRAFAYYGSATGLATSPAWTAESNQGSGFPPGTQFGFSVATAGDVNGDGYSDVIVGAPGFDAREDDQGMASVFQGSAAGLGASAVWSTVWNESGGPEFGCSVATAGDVNGDGYSDILVGAWLSDGGETDEGRAFVYHGLAAGLATTAAWTAEGNQSDAYFATAVAPAGDVNGDGYSDVIVGAPSYINGPEIYEGRVFVYHGSADGLATSPSWFAGGDQRFGDFGSSVDRAGDVNGDGYSDVIVGASVYDNGQGDEGRAYVYHGSAAGLSASPAWIAEADQDSARFGSQVACAGDVNGDGYSDVIVAAPAYDNGQTDEGRAFVYHGSAAGLSPTPAWTAESNQNGASFGGSYFGGFGAGVATAGDVNGDGFSDVIVGAELYDFIQVDRGRAFVYHGSPAGLSGSPAWTGQASPGQDFAEFGHCVASAGDVNGDGFSDVIVGSHLFDNGHPDEGQAYVYHGSATGLSLVHNWIAESDQVFARFGWSVATAGDVNGDSFSDVIVGAIYYTNGQGTEGGAFLYHGSMTGVSPSPAWTAEGETSRYFGWMVASAGDANGDGFSDVIVGARIHTNPEVNEGRAYFYYGNDGPGLDRIPQQARVFDSSTPVCVLGLSDAERSIRIRALGRTPIGRGRIRLEWEVEPFGTPLDGSNIRHGPFQDTGAPGPNGSVINVGRHPGDLEPGMLHHWRLRVATDSPFFPHSPWVSIPDNAPSEGDIRTAPEGTTAVDASPAAPSLRSLIEPNVPNPFTTATEIAYRLTRAGRHRLAVYDVQGRQVALLTEGVQPAGRHALRWDGRDAKGRPLASGTYFLRLDLDGGSEARKVTLTR